MAREGRRAREGVRAPWPAVLLGALCGALLAGTVVSVATRSAPVDQAGAAQEPVVAVAEDQPSVTFVGDSWTAGEGATGLRGYAVLVGEQLDWHYHVLGVGGSGYTRAGYGSTFDQRVGQVVDADSDIVVVQGSLNEQRTPLEDLAPAARATLGHLHAEVDPDTVVLVLGASYTPGTERDLIDGINRTVEAAADEAGFRFVDPSAENWTDPDVPGIWADPFHPNDTGYQMIADRLAPLLEHLLPR